MIEVDRHAVVRERIVGALESHPGGSIEDDATPAAVIVILERGPQLAINRELFHIPDAVER